VPQRGSQAKKQVAKKDRDFRIYFAIIKNALAAYPRTSNQDATVKAVAFCHFGDIAEIAKKGFPLINTDDTDPRRQD
jgi:hypothetical protein